MREVSKATGEKFDVDGFMKLHKAGNTLDDYLEAVKVTS